MDRFHAAASLSFFFLSACGTPHDARHAVDASLTENPGRLEPNSEAENQVLAKLDQLPSGKPQKVGSEVVSAEPPYLAASGLECRNLQLGGRARLACKDEQGWYFVPDVQGAEAPSP